MSLSLRQAIYAEMDRQSLSGRKNLPLLDSLHELQQRGATIAEGERVVPTIGAHLGQAGTIVAPSGAAFLVSFADGAEELLSPDDLQRDWLALARA